MRLRLKLEHRHALGAGRDESDLASGFSAPVWSWSMATPASRVSRTTQWLPPTVYNDPGDHMIEVTAAPTSRAGLGTSTVGGAWNARIAGFDLALEALAARILVHNSGQVAGGGTRGPWLWGDGRRNTDRVDGISNTVHPLGHSWPFDC